MSNGGVWGSPSFFESVFLDSCFVCGDGGTFYADSMFEDGFSGFFGDFVICVVAILDGEVVGFKMDIASG